jgi:hypothetical protein
MATAGKTKVAGETLAPEIATEETVSEQTGGTVRTMEQIDQAGTAIFLATMNPESTPESIRAMIDEYLLDCHATYRAMRPAATVAFDKAIAPAKAAYDKAVADALHLKDAPKVALTKGNAVVGMFGDKDGFRDLVLLVGDKGAVSAEAKASATK